MVEERRREWCLFGAAEFKVEWYLIYGPKSLFKFGEKRPIVYYCIRE